MVAFTAGSVLTAANLNTAFNTLTFRAVTGTSDTFVLADNGGAVSYSNASPITATVPPFSSVAYANGTVIQLLNLGAGVVTVTAGVGVTLNASSVTLAQNAGGTLIKTATNTWYFLPNAGMPTSATATIDTTQTTTSTTYTDLATPGPAVTLVTGTKALVIITSFFYNLIANTEAAISYAVSGATTLAASDNFKLYHYSNQYPNLVSQMSHATIRTGLTAGSNTFTLKYRISGVSTGDFRFRTISVIDLGS
jgi:hypothetical protein